MTSGAIEFHVPELNSNYFADSGHQNNQYHIYVSGASPIPTGSLSFSCDGVWFNSYGWGNQFSEYESEVIGKAILANPALNKKIYKWRCDSLKRLEKSVPRLKEEYEIAFNRRESLRKLKI